MGLNVSPDGEPPRQTATWRGRSRHDGAFAIGIEEEGSTLRLRLIGELDWACIGDVEAALAGIPAGRIKRVIFDLQKLDFMDSAGLRTILRANDRARAEPFDMVVVPPHGLAKRVFTLTRAGEQLTLVDPVPAANEGS